MRADIRDRRAEAVTEAPETRFAVPARELLLDEPSPCPFHPALALLGVAIDPAGGHHLVLDCAGVRFYTGPDTRSVARRSEILAAALRDGRTGLSSRAAIGAAAWMRCAHEVLVDELVDVISGSAPAVFCASFDGHQTGSLGRSRQPEPLESTRPGASTGWSAPSAGPTASGS